MKPVGTRKYSLWLYYGLSIAIVLAALLSVTWYVADRFRTFFVDHQRTTLEERARGLVRDIQDDPDYPAHITDYCIRYKHTEPRLRVTIIDDAGVVLCDSAADATHMENHGHRPEVQEAVDEGAGSIIRFSTTVRSQLLYVAVPLEMSGDDPWVVRTAIPLASIDGLLREVFQKLLAVTMLLCAAVSLVGVFIFRKINPPLYEIRRGAERFAHGRFERKLPDYQVREIDELAKTLNRMATQLEGLEKLRREFVANVSHELKTPVTTIKGFTETLIEGAKDDPDDLDRFLEIISRQTDRLAAIIDDLLTLSRLESAPRSEVLALDWHDLCHILNSCEEICHARAEEKQIRIHVKCDRPTPVLVDNSLLTQAIVNLVDNAIKYSRERTSVTLQASMDANHILITVTDEGPGIQDIHLPRLFERFYRADKARSRKLGGTGLGLAIVKHIANVHQGEVDVISKVGTGSTFIIRLPRQE
ncbi:MAG: ATP-binding protein [Gammaproteobacteria bacterium]|jgi:signal transduction histidine kinase